VQVYWLLLFVLLFICYFSYNWLPLFQFHPESVATHYGRQIFQNFKRITAEFGSQSSLFQERKVHSLGKLEKSEVLYMTKYFLHIPFVLHHS
jgi:hypothetical protein